MVQQLQLLGGRVDLLPVHDQLVGVQVDHQLVERQPLAGVVGDLRPPQDCIDPSDELLHLKGLHHIVVRPHLQALDAVEHLALGRQHDDGYLAGLPDLGANGPAVHHRQHDVQQDQVRHLLLEFLDGLSAVSGDADVKALLHQVHMDQVTDIAVVLHDQDVAAHGAPSQFDMSLFRRVRCPSERHHRQEHDPPALIPFIISAPVGVC